MKKRFNFCTLVLGYRCNNNCLFCTRPNDPSVENAWGFIDEKPTKQVFSELRKAREKFNAIVISGGEPSIRDDFFEILGKCIDLEFEKISLQTNARVFSARAFAQKTVSILQSRGDFYVSFHAHKKKLFNELRGTDSFEESLAGLENLLSLNARVRTNTVVMKPNYRVLPEIARFLHDLGVKEMEFAFVHPNGRAWANKEKIVPKIEKVIPFIQKTGAYLDGMKAAFSLSDFPLCLLGDYRKNASELFLAKELIFSGPKISVKAEECKECQYYNTCPGIWKNYSRIFKPAFFPVKDMH